MYSIYVCFMCWGQRYILPPPISPPPPPFLSLSPFRCAILCNSSAQNVGTFYNSHAFSFRLSNAAPEKLFQPMEQKRKGKREERGRGGDRKTDEVESSFEQCTIRFSGEEKKIVVCPFMRRSILCVC